MKCLCVCALDSQLIRLDSTTTSFFFKYLFKKKPPGDRELSFRREMESWAEALVSYSNCYLFDFYDKACKKNLTWPFTFSMWILVKKKNGGVTLNSLCQWAFLHKDGREDRFFKPTKPFWPFTRETAIDYVRELEPDKFSASSNRKRSHVSMVDRHTVLIQSTRGPICRCVENVFRNDILSVSHSRLVIFFPVFYFTCH